MVTGDGDWVMIESKTAFLVEGQCFCGLDCGVRWKCVKKMKGEGCRL